MGSDSPQKVEEEAPDNGGGGSDCKCPDCGRTFNEGAFQKHVKICKKIFSKKRKVFKPRGGAAASNGAPKAASSKAASDDAPKKVPRWKIQSEQLKAAMRASKGGPAAPAMVDPDLAPCEHCGRKFNATALAKHVDICLKVFKGKKKVQTKGGLGVNR